MIRPHCALHQVIIFTLVFILLALTNSSASDAQQTTTGAAHPVTLIVTITDKSGRYVTGLSKNQLTVLDERMPQELIYFEQTNVPISIGFVFDVASLKRAELLTAARKAALRFIAASGTTNEYFVVGFDSNPYLATDFTQDRSHIASDFDKLAKTSSSNKTALYDAIHLSIEKVKGGAHPKHIIVLISDGKDNGSKLKWNELLDTVKQSDALIYSIRVKTLGGNNLGSSILNELCSTTGGMAFYPTTEGEFSDIFERLAVELQHQYSVAFKPTSPAKDAEWHHLDFNVKPLEVKKNSSSKDVKKVPLFVRSRAGYYAHP